MERNSQTVNSEKKETQYFDTSTIPENQSTGNYKKMKPSEKVEVTDLSNMQLNKASEEVKMRENVEIEGKKKRRKQKGKRYFDMKVNPEHNPSKKHVSSPQITDLSSMTPSTIKKRIQKKYMMDLLNAKKGRKWAEKRQNQIDPYPGDAPIHEDKIIKYKRGHKMDVKDIRTKFYKKKMKEKEDKYNLVAELAARSELLLQEEAGFLEAEEGEQTNHISQHDIVEAVDISSAQKYFELTLKQFGPYRSHYTRNGRFLLIGGQKGHIATIDWQTKKLLCEINVMETINDVKWLHMETMFVVAQKQWTYIYDNQGIELHCLKGLDSVLRMEFLPYHFLLATASAKSYLSWLDVSIGQKVAGFVTGLGRLDVMCQNPHNAIVHLGHSGGTVTLWSPNVKEPLVKMLCHGSGTRSIAVNKSGQYMATSGIDRKLKIWDLRMYKLLQSYKVAAGASTLAFSQRDLLAAGIGNVVEVYKDCVTRQVESAYMSHRCHGSIQSLQFCPYEDVLGIGHADGFSSVLIPGAGEPNFDALEANPFQSKKHRRHAEVKMLLEKVQPDMINLETSALGQLDKKTLQQVMEEKKKLLFLKPQTIDFEPKYKKKGRSKAGHLQKRKQGVKFDQKQKEVREFIQNKKANKEKTKSYTKEPVNVLSRFK